MVVLEIIWNKEDVKLFMEHFETYERAWKEFEYQCDINTENMSLVWLIN